MTSAWRPRSFLHLLADAYVLFVIGFACHASWVALRLHYAVPYWDDWRILDDFFSMPLLDWIYTDQVGHRMPATLVLLFLDYRFLSGQMHLPVAVAVLCAWIGAVALYVSVRACDGLGSPLSRAALAFLCFCLFWSGACFDFVWAANQGSQQARMLFLVALTSLVIYGRRYSAGHTDTRLLVGAAALAMLATFSQGMGVATFGALFGVSLLGRFPVYSIVGYPVAAIATMAVYSIGLQHAPFGSIAAYWPVFLNDFGALLEFAVAFVGASVVHVALAWGVVSNEQAFEFGFWAGCVGLAGFLAQLVYLVGRRAPAAPAALLAGGLALFTIGGAILVALNRVAFPSSAVSTRFHTWTILFWMGVAVTCFVRSGKQERKAAWGILVLWLVSLAMLAPLYAERERQQLNRNRLEVEAVMHLAGVQSDQRARVGIDPDPEPVYRVVDRLRRDRRGFFVDGRGDLPGTPLAGSFRAADPSVCKGVVQAVRGLDAREPAAMAFGRAWDTSRDAAPQFIVITDPEGIIRGLGAMTEYAGREHGGPKADVAGKPWFAFIAGSDQFHTYEVHAILADGHTSCRFARWAPRKS